MLTAEVRVETDRPERYLAQLCQHLGNQGRHLGAGASGHRPGGHRSKHPRPVQPEHVRVEWAETSGTVTFSRRGRATSVAGRHGRGLRR